MPSRPRRDDSKLVPALVGQWERLVAETDALPDETFAAPSRLPGWTVADLVAHTARSLSLTAKVVAAAAPGRAEVTVPSYLTGTGARAEAVADIARSDASGLSPAAVRGLLRDAVGASSVAIVASASASASEIGVGVGVDLDRLVATAGGGMRLGEFLVTRVVEAVVHGLDLGVPPGRDALRIVVRAFVDTLAATAPGHTVELRVPPFAAAQVVAGPRHTRGTPPNVVEADPVAFVEVAAGRLAWGEAVADGRMRASGERSDLSGYFPLL